jgi:hypothetical protein
MKNLFNRGQSLLTDPNEDFLIFGTLRHDPLLLLDRADNSGFTLSCQRCGLAGHRAYQSRDVALIYAKALNSSSVDLLDCQEARPFAVNLVEIQPYPDPAQNDWWKVKLTASYGGRERTFWRGYKAFGKETPSTAEVLGWFWETVLDELHGFSFEDEP